MKRKMWVLGGLTACVMGIMVAQGFAQATPPPAGPGGIEAAVGTTPPPPPPQRNEFAQVLFGSGVFGFLLWVGLFGSGAAAIYFVVDCSILIKPDRIMPQALVDGVTQSMQEGDVMKALQACEKDPGPLANILSAGFSHVEEGFDVIQEAIATAADLETEKMQQRLTWISVMSNIAPMLGLLGTVQGMIMAFKQIATGAPDVGLLALAIAQALWTTAAGLCVAVPAVTAYYVLRNKANTSILKMEALTMEMIKDLRNVEVVSE
jgi:biopolymer transport protein ExbB